MGIIKNRTKALACITLLFVITINCLNRAFADSTVDDTTFQVSITNFLTLTLDTSENTVHLTQNNRFSAGFITASVSTNNSTGYALMMRDIDDENGLERPGYSIAADDEKTLYNIPSVSDSTRYDDLGDDKWGYYLGDTSANEAVYLPIPLSYTVVSSSNSSTSSLESTKVNFGVKTSPSRPSGTYSDTINFLVTANALWPEADTFDEVFEAAGKTVDEATGKYKIQEMTSEICASVQIGEEGQLVDVRDGTIYNVGKLRDNRCWLLDNLRLDLTSTSVKNNTNPNNTNADQSSLDALFGISTRDVQTDPNGGRAAAMVSNWPGSGSTSYTIYTTPYLYSSDKNVLPTTSYYNGDEPMKDAVINGNWVTGILYNVCATSAGSYCYGNMESARVQPTNEQSTAIDIKNDICPTGWRLPTGPYDYLRRPDGGEFDTLYEAYYNMDAENIYTTFRSALHMSLFGNVSAASVSGRGDYGGLWSSTLDDTIDMYVLTVRRSLSTSTPIDTQSYGSRANGKAIRCIAK